MAQPSNVYMRENVLTSVITKGADVFFPTIAVHLAVLVGLIPQHNWLHHKGKSCS